VRPKHPGPILVVDVRGLTAPDARTLETLARLQLTARRFGGSIRLRHACAQLVDLLVWSGMDDLLPVIGDSGVEPERLVEEGEQLLVDKEVDPRDPAG